MHEAALRAAEDPDRLSFLHAVRACMRCGQSGASCRCLWPFPPRRRRALHEAVLDEILEERVASSRGRRQVPRGVKRKMSNYQLRPRAPQPTTRIDFTAAIRIVK
jgi:hypothetical protein